MSPRPSSGLVSAMPPEVFDQVGARLGDSTRVSWLLHSTRAADYDLMLERTEDESAPDRGPYLWQLADWVGTMTPDQQLRTVEVLADLHNDGWYEAATKLLARPEVTGEVVAALLDQTGKRSLGVLKALLVDIVFSDHLPAPIKAVALAGRDGSGSWGRDPRSPQLAQWEEVTERLQAGEVAVARSGQLRDLVLACPVASVVAALPPAGDEAGAKQHMTCLLEALLAQRWPAAEYNLMRTRDCRDHYLLSLDPVPGWLARLEQRLGLLQDGTDGQAVCLALHRMLTGRIEDEAVVARLARGGRFGPDVAGLSDPIGDEVVQRLDEETRARLVRTVPDLLGARWLRGSEVAEQAAQSMTTGRLLGRTLLDAGLDVGPNPDWMDPEQLCAAPTEHGEHLVALLGIPRYAHAVGPLLQQHLGSNTAAWSTLLGLLEEEFDGTLGELLEVVGELAGEAA